MGWHCPIREPCQKVNYLLMSGRTAILLLAAILSPVSSLCETAEEFFESRVRPLLAKNCFACHTNSELGGLRLDSKERAAKGGKSGPAIVAGNPEASLLLHAVSHKDARLKMPPQGKLDDQAIADLKKWIEQGAVWPERAATQTSSTVITPEQRAFWAF